MFKKAFGICMTTAILFLIIGYFIGAYYPRTAKQLTSNFTG